MLSVGDQKIQIFLVFLKKMIRTMDFSKIRKPLLSEFMIIKSEEFRLLQHNPSTDVYVYERTYGRKGHRMKCIEVIKPAYWKVNGEVLPTYPSSSMFGSYGYCVNIKDYWLKEKINFWLKNGLQHFTPPKTKSV